MLPGALLCILFLSADTGLPVCTDLYQQGEFQNARECLTSLLSSGKLGETDDVVTAREYLAASYYILGDQIRAREEMSGVLKLNPDATLSLKDFPPEIVNFFEGIKKEYKSEARSDQGPESSPSLSGGEAGLTVTSSSPVPRQEPAGTLAVSLIPFGVGQIYRGDRVKGYILMGGEAGCLAVNLAALFQRQSLRNSDGSYRNLDEARTLQSLQNISAVAFYVSLAYGLGDALWGYFKGTPEDRRARAPQGLRIAVGAFPPPAGRGWTTSGMGIRLIWPVSM